MKMVHHKKQQLQQLYLIYEYKEDHILFDTIIIRITTITIIITKEMNK